MGRSLYDGSDAARAVFTQADLAVALDGAATPLSELCFAGPLEQLTLTENTQPAILTASYAAYCALRERLGAAPVAAMMAGHSLGEYTALVAAEVLDFSQAVRLVRLRGRAMQSACAQGEGAMAAVMGVDPLVLEQLCNQVRGEQPGQVVSPANFNAPGQIVIAGHSAAVARVSELCAAERGRVIPLKVSAPFHCELMKPAADRLVEALAAVTINEPTVPVIANVDGVSRHSAQTTAGLLTAQVSGAVRWDRCVTSMVDAGVSVFVELGPGRVLSALLKRIHKPATLFSVSDMASLDATAEALRQLV
jgi:[acyl-carrier-protein] S-malonyltransferase